jgi:hypothetical protein
MKITNYGWSTSSLSRPGRVVSDQLQGLIHSPGVPPPALRWLPEPATRPRACHSLVMGRVNAVARRPGA